MSYKSDYRDNKVYESDSKFAKFKPQHKITKSILLECGEGSGSRIFTSSDDFPFQIAHVTIDATSLKKPNVLIKFSSTVRFEGETDGTIRLKYELFRVCREGNAILRNTQMFEKINGDLVANSSTEDTFGFITCDCMIPSECCDYIMTVTPLEISDARAIIFNGQMALLAQSSRKC